MSTTIEALMRANLLEVFGERDPEKRRAAIERTYTRDVVFADPDEVVLGHGAIETKVAALLDGAPGFVFRPAGPVYQVHDMAYLAWEFGPDGQDPVVRGADSCFFEGDRIARVYTILFG